MKHTSIVYQFSHRISARIDAYTVAVALKKIAPNRKSVSRKSAAKISNLRFLGGVDDYVIVEYRLMLEGFARSLCDRFD